MTSPRVWLYRILIILSIGFLLLTWFMDWWGCNIYALHGDVVIIHPYGMWLDLETIGGFISLIKGYEMPIWFTPAMWIYLVICVGLLLFSLFAKNKEFKIIKIKTTLPSFIIGLVGFSYIFVCILAVIVISIRAVNFFETPLQGYFSIYIGEGFQSGAESSLRLGYWLAVVVGPLLMLLAILRNKIIGKPKTDI